MMKINRLSFFLFFSMILSAFQVNASAVGIQEHIHYEKKIKRSIISIDIDKKDPCLGSSLLKVQVNDSSLWIPKSLSSYFSDIDSVYVEETQNLLRMTGIGGDGGNFFLIDVFFDSTRIYYFNVFADWDRSDTLQVTKLYSVIYE